MNTSIAQPAPQDLIPVFQAEIGGILTNACDARLLHGFLEVGKDFSNWIKDRIRQYGFQENQDYISTLAKTGGLDNRGLQGRIEYTLTLDMGKELSMVEKNEQGRQARKYFINCERLAIEALTKTPYGLKDLASPYISESQAQQFKKSMEAHCKSNGAKYPILYRKVYEYFGITSYTHIPAGKLEEAVQLCGMKLLELVKPRMPEAQPEPFKLSFTPEELEDLVAERVKALEGEVMPRQEPARNDTITISLNQGFRLMTLVFGGKADGTQRYSVSVDEDYVSIHALDNKLMAAVLEDQGYLVIKESEVLGKLRS